VSILGLRGCTQKSLRLDFQSPEGVTISAQPILGLCCLLDGDEARFADLPHAANERLTLETSDAKLRVYALRLEHNRLVIIITRDLIGHAKISFATPLDTTANAGSGSSGRGWS
jgi:hypothetical protein